MISILELCRLLTSRVIYLPFGINIAVWEIFHLWLDETEEKSMYKR